MNTATPHDEPRDHGFARQRVMHELRRRQLTVLNSERIAPNMQRVTLGGAQLAGFTSPSPSDHMKMLFPDPATGSFDLPQPIMRDYTPLTFRLDTADTPELVVDFVLHGSDSPQSEQSADTADPTQQHRYGGPAATWAATVQPGAPARIAGPRGSLLPPTDAARAILVADESALPSVTRWLDELTATPVLVLATLADPATASYLDDYRAPQRDFEWFSYEPDSSSLLSRLRDTTITHDTFVYLAGEAGALIPLRRYLRRELGLPNTQIEVHGYWKKGVVALDHHAPLDPSDPEE